MTNSSFCLQQRQQEEQKSRKLLTIGLIGSIVLHGAIGSAAMLFKEEPKTTNKPIELIIVDAPKPVPEVPKPKLELPKPVKVTPPPPKPQPPKTEPVKTVQPQATKPKPAKPKIENRRVSAEPVQPRVAKVTPKPEPRIEATQPQPRPSILTTPRPAASSFKVPEQPKVESNFPVVPSEPIRESRISQPPSTGSLQGSNTGSEATSGNGDSGNGNDTGGNSGTSTVAARPTPEPPKPTPQARQRLKCVSNCDIKYSSVLNGAEGTAFVRLTVDDKGNVVDAQLAQAHSNSQINEQALVAARKIKFAPRPGEGNQSIRYRISFTRPGTDTERLAREREERNRRERQAREQREQQERQAREQQERQRQAELEQERRAQQQQQQQQQQPPLELPPTDLTPSPEPLPLEVPETGQ
jgi:periplasmic protein TonB